MSRRGGSSLALSSTPRPAATRSHRGALAARAPARPPRPRHRRPRVARPAGRPAPCRRRPRQRLLGPARGRAAPRVGARRRQDAAHGPRPPRPARPRLVVVRPQAQRRPLRPPLAPLDCIGAGVEGGGGLGGGRSGRGSPPHRVTPSPAITAQVRFATLRFLNDVLGRCMELVDTSRPPGAAWTLAAKLRRVDGVVFADSRSRLIDAAVQATRIPTPAPRFVVRLDNALAFQSFDAGITDAGLSSCLFMQCWRQLHAYSARLFRHVPDEVRRRGLPCVSGPASTRAHLHSRALVACSASASSTSSSSARRASTGEASTATP